jgi:hypothetical protein
VTNDCKVPLPAAVEVLQVEQYLGDEFRAVAPNHLEAGTLALTRIDIEWWPIMRHYGVPTRILDWTASIYVAAYFAVSKQSDKDGVVYIVHPNTLERAMKASYSSFEALPKNDAEFKQPDSPPTLYVFNRKTALLDRMIAQQGLFMVCRNVVGDIEEILASEIPKVADSDQLTLKRLRIPAAEKPGFMCQLRSMNVTARSLFPGLDGIGRHLEETIKCR